MKLPAGLDYWTADEVAECLSLDDPNAMSPESLYQRLWDLNNAATNHKPLGGDGSNGTTEEPIVSNEYNNNMKAIWDHLNVEEQLIIIKAYKANA